MQENCKDENEITEIIELMDIKHRIPNPRAGGSNPLRRTTYKNPESQADKGFPGFLFVL